MKLRLGVRTKSRFLPALSILFDLVQPHLGLAGYFGIIYSVISTETKHIQMWIQMSKFEQVPN